MLRISSVGSGNGVATLRLDGRVIGPWVDELRRCCDQLLGEGSRITLDLAEVSFVNTEGLALFRDLITRGITLVNCPLFLKEQLKQVADRGKRGRCDGWG